MSKPFAAKGAGACPQACSQHPAWIGSLRTGGDQGAFYFPVSCARRSGNPQDAEVTMGDASVVSQDDPTEQSDRTGHDRALGIFSKAGLERLYRNHGVALLHRLSCRIGREDAGDLVQEAFARLAAMTPAKRLAIECPEAFVTTVATNALRDRARAAARQAVQGWRIEDREGGVGSDPHDLMECREALFAIERALKRMKPLRRRIFMLHRFDHLTYAEIGEEVGMSEKGVKKQIAKALFELRQAVGRGA